MFVADPRHAADQDGARRPEDRRHRRLAGVARRRVGARAQPAARSAARTRSSSSTPPAGWSNDEGFKGKPICMMAIESRVRRGRHRRPRVRGQGARLHHRGHRSFKGTPDEDFTAQIAPAAERQVRGGVPHRAADEHRPHHRRRRPAGPHAAVDRPVADVGQRAGRQPALAPLLQKNFYWTSEGTTWGDTSVAGHEGDDRRRRQVHARPEARRLLRVRLLAGQGRARLLEQAVENGDLSRAGILKAIEEVERRLRGPARQVHVRQGGRARAVTRDRDLQGQPGRPRRPREGQGRHLRRRQQPSRSSANPQLKATCRCQVAVSET